MTKTIDGTGGANELASATFVNGSTIATLQATPGGTTYNFNLPDTAGNTGDILTSGGGGSNEMTWTSASFGTGTVTSVGVTTPAFMTSSGGPITTAGTITLGLSGTPLPVINGGTGVTTSTGTGSGVHSTNPVIVTPTISAPTLTGTTAAGALTLTTPLAVTSGGTGTTTSTGTTSVVLNTNPTLVSASLTSTTTSIGPIDVTNATVSTSTTTGALKVVGGVGIQGDLNVGGTITGTVVPGSINTSGQIITSNATASTSITTGAIIASNANGGLGVGGNINAGGLIRSTNATNSTSATTGAITSGGGLGVSGDCFFAAKTTIKTMNHLALEVTAANTTLTATSNNYIVFNSGLSSPGINLPNGNSIPLGYQVKIINITVGNSVNIRNSSASTQYTLPGGDASVVATLTGAFSPGTWTFKSNATTTSFDFRNTESISTVPLFITDTTNSTSSSTGSLVISGGIGISQDITVGGIAKASSLTTNSVDQFTYSTGTWTPTLAGDVTYTTQAGRYIQMGSEVKVAIRIIFEVNTSGPDLEITNLPFTTGTNGLGFGIIGQGGITGVSSVLVARGTDSSDSLFFFNPNTEAAITLDNTWPTVTIEGLVTYFI